MINVESVQHTARGIAKRLPVVRCYKHLGSWAKSAIGTTLDVVRKASDIRVAAKPLRKHVLANSYISMKERLTLTNSLVFSRGLFAAGAWPRLLGAESKIIQHAMMTVYRSVAKQERWTYSKCNDVEVLQRLETVAPSISIRLKWLRLRTSLITRRCWPCLILLVVGQKREELMA